MIIRKKGFTILELLISAMLLALIVAGLISIFVTGKRYTMHSTSRIQAAELGKLFADPLHMQVRQDQWAANCLGTGNNCSAEFWTIPPVVYRADFTWTSVVNGIPGNTLRKVTTRITWTEPEP